MNCFSIQFGGLLIAITDMVLSVIGICLSSAFLLFQVCLQLQCRVAVVINTVPEHKQREFREAIEAVFWLLVLFIVMCIKQIVFNALLIHGIRKNDLRKVRLWLVFKACVVVIGIFLILNQDSTDDRRWTIFPGVYRQITEILYVFLTLFFMCNIFILYDIMYRRRHQVTSNRLVDAD